MKTRIFLLYDGIYNSVFQGQVVKPLCKQLERHPNDRGIIISFEKIKPSQETLQQLINHPRITLIILRKIPFCGSVTLYYAAYQLKKVLKQYHPHIITARGPLAAWIIGHSRITNNTNIIVQARGLSAQEHCYAHKNSSWFACWLHAMRARQYEHIERWVYGTYAHNPHVEIRTISTALQDYLVNTFSAPKHKIKKEQSDIPVPISQKQIVTWCTSIRAELGIPSNVYVYVYNGSAKPWQCPKETIQFFAKEYQKNQKSFLLVLTQDTSIFKALLAQSSIAAHAYYIISVPHTHIYQYLAAADAGILLRKNHIINWVSRPTKALEYQAVGLKIIHNNTVGMLDGDRKR